MASRGMGAINPKKMPKNGKPSVKKPTAKKFAAGGETQAEFKKKPKEVNPLVADAEQAEKELREYGMEWKMGIDREGNPIDRSKIPSPEVQEAQQRAIYKRMIDAAAHGYKPRVKPGYNYGFETPKSWGSLDTQRKAGGLLRKKKRGR